MARNAENISIWWRHHVNHKEIAVKQCPYFVGYTDIISDRFYSFTVWCMKLFLLRMYEVYIIRIPYYPKNHVNHKEMAVKQCPYFVGYTDIISDRFYSFTVWCMKLFLLRMYEVYIIRIPYYPKNRISLREPCYNWLIEVECRIYASVI